MDTVAKIKSYLKEANLYQTQGLLNEARTRYKTAESLIRESDEMPNKTILLEGIKKKLQSLIDAENKIEKKAAPSEISSRDRDLIKKVFASSKSDDQDKAQLEGAVALAKFGQFERAILEFEELLTSPSVRITAAKHILRCHIALRAMHDPIAKYKKWETNEIFPLEELEKVRFFLENTYGTSSAQPGLPGASIGAPGSLAVSSPDREETSPASDYDPYQDDYVDILDALDISKVPPKGATLNDDEYIDVIKPKKEKTLRYEDIEGSVDDYVDYISSIGIQMTGGVNNGQPIELAVNLQTGKDINLIVPSKERDLLKMLKKGSALKDVKLNSPISVNTGNCRVVAVARIDQGPKKGDYSVDLKLEV